MLRGADHRSKIEKRGWRQGLPSHLAMTRELLDCLRIVPLWTYGAYLRNRVGRQLAFHERKAFGDLLAVAEDLRPPGELNVDDGETHARDRTHPARGSGKGPAPRGQGNLRGL